MVGANRILRGVAITHPFGEPARARASELALRRRLVERALEMLETEVEAGTIWESAGNGAPSRPA
jgi:glycine reductase